jgi:hypothetical protein
MTANIRLYSSLLGLMLVMPVSAHAGGGWDVAPTRSKPIALHQAVMGEWYQGAKGFKPTYPDPAVFKAINLSEWSRLLNLTVEQAEAVVYRLEQLEQVTPDVVAYLRLVHGQEELVSEQSYWTRKETFKKDPAGMVARYQNAITETERLLNQTHSQPLKMRALFVAMRLAHYAGLYGIETQLYAQHGVGLRQNPSVNQSEVWHWIDALRAGRLMRVAKSAKERAEAAYMFAMIFLNSTSKRGEAFQNFAIRTDQEWTRLTSLCRNDNERALMHVLRASKRMGSPANELQMVAKLYPSTRWAYALLAWSLVDLEDVLILAANNRNTRQKAALTQFRKSIELLQRSGLPADGFLLGLAKVYSDDSSKRTASLDALAKRYPNDQRTSALDGIRVVLFLSELTGLGPAEEAEIGNLIDRYKKHADIHRLTRHVFKETARMYKTQNSVAKHMLTKHAGIPPHEGLSNAQIEAVWSFFRQKPHNTFETFLQTNAWSEVEYRSIKALRRFADQQLDEMMGLITRGILPSTRGELGRRLLEQMQYERALHVLEAHHTGYSIESTWRFGPDYTPFVTTVGSHNRGSAALVKPHPWSRLRFAKEMVRLKKVIKQSPQDTRAQFLYATGLYNSSWFGNHPLLNLNQRMTSGFPSERPNLTNTLNAAQYHYQFTVENTSQRELKVKALYALSKIELAKLLMSTPPRITGSQNPQKLKEKGFGRYFKLLKQYEDTRYFREVISACGVYQNFE